MNRSAWIIRLAKTPDGKWRALAPVWLTQRGKEVLTNRALYKGQEIETPDGHWEVEWIEDGKRRRQRVDGQATDVVKARDTQQLRLRASAAGIAVHEAGTKNAKRPLKQAVDEFLAEKKSGKAKKTWQAHTQVLTLFQATVKHKYLEDIRRADIMDKFISTLKEQGLGDRTVNHRFCCLLSFLKANDLKLVTQRDAPRYVKTEIRTYSQADLDALFAACAPDEQLLFEFFLFSGCREQEVMHAEWDDLVGQSFIVREKKQYGFKPKGRRERIIRLPDHLMRKLASVERTGSLIFPHPSGRPDGHLLRRLKAVVKRANLKATHGLWTLHVFRHTCATMHLQAGTDVRSVQKMLGHEDLKTTQSYCDYLDAHGEKAGVAANRTFAIFAPDKTDILALPSHD